MRNAAFIAIALCLGCHFGRETHQLEFTQSTQTIKLLSEDCYIKSIQVESTNAKDSGHVAWKQGGDRGRSEMILGETFDNYPKEGTADPQKLLQEKALEYTVIIEKFGIYRTRGKSDNDTIRFVSDDIRSEKNIFESKHP